MRIEDAPDDLLFRLWMHAQDIAEGRHWAKDAFKRIQKYQGLEDSVVNAMTIAESQLALLMFKSRIEGEIIAQPKLLLTLWPLVMGVPAYGVFDEYERIIGFVTEPC